MDFAANEDVLALIDIRRQAGFSLENLSDALKISKGELSRMEQGKRGMPKGLFDKALKFMNISWEQETVKDLEDRISRMVALLYEMELEQAADLLEGLKKDRKKHRYSSQYFWWLFIDYIGSVVFKAEIPDRPLENLESVIFNYYGFYPCNIQILLKDLQSLRTEKQEEPDRNQQISLFNRSTVSWTLLMYHQFYRIARNGSLYEAIELYDRIEAALKTTRNFKRLLDIDILKSVILIRIGEYEPAERILLNTLEKIEKLGYLDLKTRIMENLIWNALKSGQKEAALKYMKETAVTWTARPDDSNIVFAPLCLLGLERNDEALQAVDWMKQNARLNKLNQKILLMSENLIKKNFRMFVRIARNCQKEALKMQENETAKFILDIQISFYEQEENWEEAYRKTIEKSNMDKM